MKLPIHPWLSNILPAVAGARCTVCHIWPHAEPLISPRTIVYILLYSVGFSCPCTVYVSSVWGCVHALVKTTVNLSTWFTSYSKKNFMEKNVYILSPVFMLVWLLLQIHPSRHFCYTRQTIGSGIGLYSFIVSIHSSSILLKWNSAVIFFQECPFRKLQLAHTNTVCHRILSYLL